MMNGDREEIKKGPQTKPWDFPAFHSGVEREEPVEEPRRSSQGGGRKVRSVWWHGSRSRN